MLEKKSALEQLAIKRRQTTPPEGSFPIGHCDYHGGIYEYEYVSPYTKGANNVDADIFLLLQDWSSDQEMRNSDIDLDVLRLGRTPGLPTNQNLEQLLSTYFGINISGTYGTNLYPFIKPGNMSARIPQRYLVDAAKEFALPQIRIVEPKLVICFGKATFNALRKAVKERPVDTVNNGINAPFTIPDSQTLVWLQSHPGALGKINRNKVRSDQVSDDWLRMKEQFHTIP